MGVGHFHIPGDATKREYAAYIMVATNRKTGDRKLYVGKTGDNRDGCNPVISRAGNHLSFNKIHSQMRNYLLPDEPQDYDFDYFYATFGCYMLPAESREGINIINEMERQLNRLVNDAFAGKLLNPYLARGWVNGDKMSLRQAMVTPERKGLLTELVQAVQQFMNNPAASSVQN